MVDSVYEKEITSNGWIQPPFDRKRTLDPPLVCSCLKNGDDQLDRPPLGGARTETPHELLEYHFCRGALDEYGP